MLEIKNLQVSFHTYAGEVQAVRGVDLTVPDDSLVAIVGESGCGKSVTAQSVIRLHDPEITQIKNGKIVYNGVDLLGLTDKEMEKVRGKEISMVFQDPMTSLNPTMTIGRQITEVLLAHTEDGEKLTREDAKQRAIELLKTVRLPNAEERYGQFPHVLSGGQRQRVMIAIAMACTPKLLIADEPTTALDVTVQAQIMELMRQMREKHHTSIILITHDLGVVANFAEYVNVMYGGMVVESGTTDEIYHNAAHPYTHALLKSVSRLTLDKNEPLHAIDGTPPDLVEPPKGCPFADRCPYAMQVCKDHLPEETKVAEKHICRCWLTDPDCPVKPEWEV